MKAFDFGPIIALIAFILIPLANYAFKRMKRRIEEPGPARKVPEIREGLAEARLPASPHILHEAASRRAVASANRSPETRLFRNRRDVRRGVLAMTVLGPCRANESTG